MIDINKKYTTRDGNAVRIYATDGEEDYPIHGAYLSDEGFWCAGDWAGSGCYSKAHGETDFDLIEVKEPEQEGRDVDALQAELDAALRVAFNRGATEYVRNNYPGKYAEFAKSETVTVYRGLSIMDHQGEIIWGAPGCVEPERYPFQTHILRLDITGDEVTATVEKVGG